MQDTDNKKDLDKIPDVDENGDPIYKIDSDKEGEENSTIGEKRRFQDTSQDLKDETSQE